MKRFLFPALLLLANLGGCQRTPPLEYLWTEEVLLNDGRMIIVERRERMHAYREAGYSEVRVEKSTLVIAPPGEAALPALEVKERPIVLGFDEARQQWFVITNLGLCDVARSLGLGDRPYFEYRYSQGKWHQGHVGDDRVGLSANLLLDRKLVDGRPLVRVLEKDRTDRTNAIPIYLRKVVSTVPC